MKGEDSALAMQYTCCTSSEGEGRRPVEGGGEGAAEVLFGCNSENQLQNMPTAYMHDQGSMCSILCLRAPVVGAATIRRGEFGRASPGRADLEAASAPPSSSPAVPPLAAAAAVATACSSCLRIWSMGSRYLQGGR